MNGLLMHCGANSITRDELANLPTPIGTRSHYPVAHYNLLDAVTRTVSDGYEIRQEGHGVTADGSRYFGLLELGIPGQDDDDHGLVVGIRNSHDKSFAASLAVGSRVFVCDNLSFSGDVVVSRKHTRHIYRDLYRVVADTVGRLGEQREAQERQFAAYKDHQLRHAEAHDFVVRSIDAKVIAASKLPHVLREWREPSHEEFAEHGHSAWRLFNAYTEVFKSHDVSLTHLRSRRLHGLLDAHIGLAV